MCGIFLYLSKSNMYEKSLALREKIITNFSKIQHRGPDNSTFMNVNDKLIFGFHRLAIVDKSILGNQPFIEPVTKNSSIYVMCNGEIYNYKQLIMEYNLKPKSNSDCEVILQLYKHFTTNLKLNENETIKTKIQKIIFKIANMLDGVFAFNIYDERYRMLSIGRDPIGIRSLYYGYDNESICFSSEMKAITNLSNHVEFFPPGSVISFDIDDIYPIFKMNLTSNVQRFYYYNYPYKTKITDKDYDYYKLKINHLLTKAVDKRIIGDRPIGCLLSGGLDSSLIAALLAKKMKKEGKNFIHFQLDLKMLLIYGMLLWLRIILVLYIMKL